jgi:N-acetylneuraminate lyase
MPNALLASTNRIIPALVTPLTPSGELDVKSTERLIDHLYQTGVGGLYITGSTGEGIYLDFGIRKRIAEIAVSRSKGRGNVIVHVGAIQSAMAIELANHAAKIGADAISSIPPFAGGYSWAEVHSFYSDMARASKLPVIAYYIPGLTGQQRSIEELVSLLSVPNIAGYKFTEFNLYTMQRLLTRFGPEQIMYNGPDEMLAFGLQFGAHGGIGTTYNVIPELIVKIAQRTREGRFAEAVATQIKANEVIEPLIAAHGVASTKQILVWQGLIDHPHCAAPRALLSEEQKSALRRRLEATSIASTLVRS